METTLTTNGLNSNYCAKMCALNILLEQQTREELCNLARMLNVPQGNDTKETLKHLQLYFGNGNHLQQVRLNLSAVIFDGGPPVPLKLKDLEVDDIVFLLWDLHPGEPTKARVSFKYDDGVRLSFFDLRGSEDALPIGNKWHIINYDDSERFIITRI